MPNIITLPNGMEVDLDQLTQAMAQAPDETRKAFNTGVTEIKREAKLLEDSKLEREAMAAFEASKAELVELVQITIESANIAKGKLILKWDTESDPPVPLQIEYHYKKATGASTGESTGKRTKRAFVTGTRFLVNGEETGTAKRVLEILGIPEKPNAATYMLDSANHSVFDGKVTVEIGGTKYGFVRGLEINARMKAQPDESNESESTTEPATEPVPEPAMATNGTS